MKIIPDPKIMAQISKELATMTEEEKDHFNTLERYYELWNQLKQEQADDNLYEMVERDYSPEALKELLKNPNEW